MRKMWGIGLLMVALSAASAEPAPKPIHFRAHARVALDAQGVPQQVDVDQKLPAVIRDAIAQRVGQWRFEPARAGEQPLGLLRRRAHRVRAPRPFSWMRAPFRR